MSATLERIPWWRDRRVVPWIVQAVVGLALLLVITLLVGNLVRNLTAAGLLLSWRWLGQPASFDVAESLIPFDASMPYWRALLVGLVNSLRVILVGLVGATLLGTAMGMASFSGNGLLRRLARVYVELIRNIPLLLQLLFWYFVVFLALPNGTAAFQLPGIVLSKSGLYLAWFAQGLSWQGPELVNGVWQAPLRLSVEFTALLTGLITYTGAFVAEVVRGGIASVPKGQWEAATSLGLHWSASMRSVVLPQALRVIVPGLNSQYISLAKNSSLAVAVGYVDLYSVSETTLNQTGRALEVFLLLLGSYLIIDLLISAVMNGVNQLVQIRER
ncbi:ABC transporter permease subunit [Synechococcus sp. Cruz-9H2]|uniref:ABC transporter permease subunit n=1 Tax=unclassified Synechococcus TaxID=2626047 RepID=UPI0020CE6661|nr:MULTISPECIES: ABC transporter permease subunit [unclassified Synechococcus]MCP9818250.1 ABC transporter permease subunit [Synechococcus sp. Cruz-9H2]MCP9842250.1 ABC transporter permease subunit [Synechococcus sp. Edmonson 11F2]MCP9854646.1 ABC transporter permease subunit [Synechococcus sp. Cruz-9C9]MCP9861658.1 ABC transporter permease subunit [Synechococcus sp. Cruz-7E5]MCP9869158.1 ABC transporter permease subunit [Synechococcus sp. Cruz-7B9]